ncbi:AHH domain-containing protein, partial [Burkholderia multivorans]|uniref:AHH domain-containing protein n=1 Tax=Burkholderia multivorans TaxID=87883 RepID=UPI0020B3F52F
GQHTYFHDYLPCKHWPSKKGPSYPGGSNPMCCRWVIFNVLLTLNGVFLPNRNNTDNLAGILHNGKHPNTYFQRVNQLLQDADLGGKQAVLDQLQTIRETLQNASRDTPWKSVLSEL